MSLPSYNDLGFNVKRLFGAGYNIGLVSVSSKNKTTAGVEFVANGTHNIEDSSVTTNLELKFRLLKYGLGLKTTWDTENAINNELTWQDYREDGSEGLQIGGSFQYLLDSAAKSWSTFGKFPSKIATVNATAEGSDGENMLVNGGIVAGFRGFIAGCQAKYDTVDGTFKKDSTSTFGYFDASSNSLLITVDLLDGNVTGSFYNQINPKLEMGVISSPLGEDGPFMSIASKYIVDECGLTLRGKFNNKSELTLGCEVKVLEGTSLSFASEINLKDFNAGGHKFGVGLDFQ